MKFFATTKCPKCGNREIQELDGPNFRGKEESKCTKCGQLYSTIFNLLIKTSDEKKAKGLVNENRQGEKVEIVTFSTEQLVEELRRRNASV